MSAYNDCTYGNMKGILYMSHIWLYSMRLYVDLLLLVVVFHSCSKYIVNIFSLPFQCLTNGI